MTTMSAVMPGLIRPTMHVKNVRRLWRREFIQRKDQKQMYGKEGRGLEREAL